MQRETGPLRTERSAYEAAITDTDATGTRESDAMRVNTWRRHVPFQRPLV